MKTTVHTGEDGDAAEMAHVLSVLPLDRLNHGFRAYTDPVLMKTVREKDLTMCLCPTSNMRVGFIKDKPHLNQVLRSLYDNGVKFCVNTDNPAMLRTNLRKELDLVREAEALTEDEIAQTTRWAFEAAFVPTEAGKNLYL